MSVLHKLIDYLAESKGFQRCELSSHRSRSVVNSRAKEYKDWLAPQQQLILFSIIIEVTLIYFILN